MICPEKSNFKAPNGNESQLYSTLYDNYGHEIAMRAYLHVRTPKFKEWFGDWENNPQEASKVVDENGEPQVLWHGSAEEFIKEKESPSFYATPNINYAQRYGKSSAERLEVDESKVTVRPLFMNIRNPQRFDSNEVEYDTISNINQQDAEAWKAWGNDGLHYIEERAYTSDGKYQEYVVFDADNIYFVDKQNSIKKEIATNEDVQSDQPTVRVTPANKRFFSTKEVEDYLKTQDGIASKKFNNKIYVKADSEGTSNYGKALRLVNRVNEENPGLLKVVKQYDESRKAGRDVHTISINEGSLKRNRDEFTEREREANEHIIPLDTYEQVYGLDEISIQEIKEGTKAYEGILNIPKGESVRYNIYDNTGEIGTVVLDKNENNNLRIRWIRLEPTVRRKGISQRIYRKLHAIALSDKTSLVSDSFKNMNQSSIRSWESLVRNNEAEKRPDGTYIMKLNLEDINKIRSDVLTKENRADFEAKKDLMLNTFPMVEEVIEDYTMEAKGKLEQNGRVIRVNPNKFTTDTIGHEFAHLLIDLIGGLENPLVKRALEELRGTDLEQRVRNKYQDVSQEVQDKEVLAQAIGEDTAEIFKNIQDQQEREARTNRFARLLMRIFNRIKQLLHIEKSAVRSLAKKVVSGDPTVATQTQEEAVADEYFQRSDEISEEEKRQLRELISQRGRVDTNITKVEEMRQEAIDRINTKIAIYQTRGNSEQVSKLNEELEKMKQADGIESLARFTSLAARQTQSIYNRYVQLKGQIDRGETTNKELAKLFYQWYDYLSAFDMLKDVRDHFVDTFGISEIENRFPQLKKMIDNTLANKDMLKSKYEKDSKTILANMLVKYDTRAFGEFKQEKETEWRQWTKEQREAKPLEQFLNEEVEANREYILENTRKSLRNEANKASFDISVLARWMDNMLDTNDEVIASAVKAFVIAHDKSRQESIQVRDEMVDLVRDLENHMGYNTLSSPQSLYDPILEKNKDFEINNDTYLPLDRTIYVKQGKKGQLREAYVLSRENRVNEVEFIDTGERVKLTPGKYYYRPTNAKYAQHIISKYYSEFWEQFQSMKAEVNQRVYKNKDIDEANELRKEAIRAWKQRNTNFDTEGFNDAKYALLDKLVDEGLMKQSERDQVEESDVRRLGMTVADVVGENSEANTRFLKWLSENEWEYRSPKEEWRNPEWDKLEKLREKGKTKEGKQTNPVVRFYDYIVEKNREVDEYLPYKYRLGTKLPSASKDFIERIRSGYNIGKAIKGSTRKQFTRRPEETEKGQKVDRPEQVQQLVKEFRQTNNREPNEEEIKDIRRQARESSSEVLRLKDENQNEKMFLPIFYSSNIAEEEQSYDLASIYNMRFRMGIDYKYKSEILPELELTQFVVNNREVTETARGNPVKNALKRLRDKHLTKKGSNSYLAMQFNDWMKSAVYGRQVEETGEFDIFGVKVDTTKFLQTINTYTAMNLLGLNFVQGTANWGLGQVMQRIEAFAGEHFNMKDYERAGIIYKTNLPGILGDIGSRSPKNKLSKLEEFYDLLHDWGSDPRMRKHNRFRQLMTRNTAFFTAHAGEHMMQVRAMVAMMINQKIKDKDGNTMKRRNGKDMTLYHALVVDEKTGQIRLDKDVEKNSDWTLDDALQYGNKIKRLLSRLHGEYSQIGSNALQRYALGQMAMMFRKFVVPGFKRRFETSRRKDENGNWKMKYNELSETFTEGNYVTTWRFLTRLVKDLVRFKFEIANKEWSGMTTVERANVKRTLGEVTALLGAWMLAQSALKLIDEADDDREKYWYRFAAFHGLRLRSELMFFVNPIETMRLLRSPAASLSMVQNLIETANILLNPFDDKHAFEELERGPNKGQTRAGKHLEDLTPFWKQYDRVTSMDSMLSWFQK